ncbi:MAG: hypothetical protein HC767_00430 [Akkermansiaceae bacterium]|nr:hypothetical protein [Akkermansiaceae bacterium]
MTFKPKAKGKLSTSLQILSNDRDENPFTINVRGSRVPK